MSDIGLGPHFAIAFVLVFAVAFAVWVAVGGAVMKLAARWAGGVGVGYGRACGVVALAGVATFALSGAMMAAIAAFGYDSGLSSTVLIAGRALLGLAIPVVSTAAFAWLLLPGHGTHLSPARALGVGALFCVVMLALYAVLVMLPILLIGGVPGVSR